MRRLESHLMAALAAGSLALTAGGLAHAQNTIGGDEFPPGVADFVQNGSTVGSGPPFQFSDEFYAANGIDGPEIRNQEAISNPDPTTPDRRGAFYRGIGDVWVADGTAPDDRFLDDTRIRIHNMGFNAAGEQLFYPDPPAFFFASAFTNQETEDLSNRSFVYGFPRTVPGPNPVAGCENAAFTGDLLDPGPCGRRQDNIFDTGNGYLTTNPLQLWRITFITWTGPDVDTPECQAEMARLADKNGLDLDGTPILTTTAEVLNVAGPDLIAGQGDDEMVLPNTHPGAKGLKPVDPRSTIPGVEFDERGQVCVEVRVRRQHDAMGSPASAENTLDGPPFVV